MLYDALILFLLTCSRSTEILDLAGKAITILDNQMCFIEDEETFYCPPSMTACGVPITLTNGSFVRTHICLML